MRSSDCFVSKDNTASHELEEMLKKAVWSKHKIITLHLTEWTAENNAETDFGFMGFKGEFLSGVFHIKCCNNTHFTVIFLHILPYLYMRR